MTGVKINGGGATSILFLTGFAFAPSPAYGVPMQDTATLSCPFCGQENELALDTSIATQRFTTDCEVCCRPFEVCAECEDGEILSLAVVE